MRIGHLYFLEDQYFVDFDDDKLMKNHETVNGIVHNRPCYCCLSIQGSSIYWMVPISSKVDKYRRIYNNKIARYGICDTIEFGNILGYEKAFLIQNMCPVTEKYIKNEYRHFGAPVGIDYETSVRIQRKVAKVLALMNNNTNLIYPNVREIEEKLKRMV